MVARTRINVTFIRTLPVWLWRKLLFWCTIMKSGSRLRLKCDGTRAETRFGLSVKRTSPFKSAGASVHSTTGSRGLQISGSKAGYAMFRDSVRVLATHSIRQFPLHFPTRASPCAITFQLDSNFANNVFPIYRITGEWAGYLCYWQGPQFYIQFYKEVNFLHFVNRALWYIYVIRTNKMHILNINVLI